MALKEQSGIARSSRPGRSRRVTPAVARDSQAEAEFIRGCAGTARKSRRHLLGVAIARGCRHYAPLWPELKAEDDRNLPHEALGCALLQGPADVATFQAIRCGAMILSDLANTPQRIAVAADKFGVADRVAHIARIGSAADEHREFWEQILKALPDRLAEDRDFLPGVSRLVVETRASGPGRGAVRQWLRTAYRR